ncbi:hypothetical protein PAHAL_7G210300 [Panicum hallii]|uniref:Uncharacterized protein n=1 Tax=Panicum hallii TaxID=206008 RepID=A0A2S3I8W2_9POAL|nr:uncharacterized protein LOC112898858 [Panicum hallii]PAN38976.1 hypothetical protein PAHAL_7G210300 [Panicum hallii]
MASNAPADSPADLRRCICSPTTHPGSFRCRLHRGGVGMPRSASCQQFGDAGAPGSRSLRPSHMRRPASQQQFAVHSTTVGGGGMSKPSSEQLFRPLGLPRSASCQDFFPKE